MCGYAAYVAVCAKYKTIMKIFCPATAGPGGSGDEEFYIDFNLEDPVEWDQTAQDPGSDMRQMLDLGNPRQTTGDGAQPLMPNAMDENRASLQLSLDGAAFGMDYGEVIMHGFMYKKSEFYAKARMSSGMWQKRWCVIDDTKFFYTRKNGKDRVLIGGPSSWSECRARSTTYTEFILTTPGGEYVFKCAKPAVARKWLRAIAARIEYYKTLSPSSRHVGDSNAAPEEHAEEIHDLLAWPATIGGRAWFIFVCPLLVIFRYTVPDVRYPRWTNFYPATMIIAVCWLAVLAEGMMTGAENSGRILEIPEDIMGLTVTAAGTSLPNLFASLIVAKQGLGNMSVSNAFGSNTFNIFVALAFPWFVGSMVKSNWVPPHGTQSYSYHVCKGPPSSAAIFSHIN
jgi:Ca2+/Na+ antiporter